LDSGRRFATERLSAADPAKLPYSFVYDGRPSSEVLATWQRSEKTESLDGARTRRTVAYTDPQTGMQVRCEAVECIDFPTVEWTLFFRNTGRTETPILENVQALDIAWQRAGEDEFLLHHAAGSQANRSDYGPRETVLPLN